MKIIYHYKITFLILLSISSLSAIEVSERGCIPENIFAEERFKIREEKPLCLTKETNISRELKSVKVYHKNQALLIERTLLNDEQGFIEPMNISKVKTVAELETLAFIKTLKEKKNRLLIDVRENKFYNMSTIPGAINLPSSMLQEDSKYLNKVINLLGMKKVAGKRQLEDVPNLLIFDNGIIDNKASQAIKSLLKLSYPEDKILYYRGGIKSWETLGLTLYK